MLLLVGMLGISAVYTLAGLWLTSHYESLNQFLMPSVLAILFLLLPFGSALGLPWQWWVWHPLMPALQLVQAGTVPLPAGQILYGLVGTLTWVWLGFSPVQTAFDRLIRPSARRRV